MWENMQRISVRRAYLQSLFDINDPPVIISLTFIAHKQNKFDVIYNNTCSFAFIYSIPLCLYCELSDKLPVNELEQW